jgi:hypothetical protein
MRSKLSLGSGVRPDRSLGQARPSIFVRAHHSFERQPSMFQSPQGGPREFGSAADRPTHFPRRTHSSSGEPEIARRRQVAPPSSRAHEKSCSWSRKTTIIRSDPWAHIDRSRWRVGNSGDAFAEIHFFNMWRQEMIRMLLTTATVIAAPMSVPRTPIVPPRVSRRPPSAAARGGEPAQVCVAPVGDVDDSSCLSAIDGIFHRLDHVQSVDGL